MARWTLFHSKRSMAACTAAVSFARASLRSSTRCAMYLSRIGMLAELGSLSCGGEGFGGGACGVRLGARLGNAAWGKGWGEGWGEGCGGGWGEGWSEGWGWV